MPKTSINPYSPGNPVQPRHFAGRIEIINRIRQAIRDCKSDAPTNLFLQGEWGTGKTSILRKLKPELQEQLGLVIREDVSGQGAKDQSTAFYLALFEELMDALGDDSDEDDFVSPDFNNSRSMRITLTKQLARLRSEKGLFAAIILDNLDKADQQFLSEIRDVFQRIEEDDAHFMLLFAGQTLPRAGASAAEPVSRFFETIEINTFTKSESKEAIEKPIKAIGEFNFTDSALDFIYLQTEGHPYFLKQICHKIFSLACGSANIDDAWLEDHWAEIESDLAKAKFRKDLDLPESERDVILQAGLLGDEFKRSDLFSDKPSSLDSALKRLRDDRHLIKPVSRGIYRFYHPLFGKYVRTQAAKGELHHPLLKTISTGESEKLEFKETYSYNTHTKINDDKLIVASLKTIAAFQNSDGGTLLIGVSDNGDIKGLKKDFTLCKPNNPDGFERKVLDHLEKRLNPYIPRRVAISFITLPAGNVCVVDVKSKAKATYVDEDEFYVREGNRTVMLKGETRDEYIRKRTG